MTFVSFFLSTRGAFPERSSTAGRRSCGDRGPRSFRPYGPRTTPKEKPTVSRDLIVGAGPFYRAELQEVADGPRNDRV